MSTTAINLDPERARANAEQAIERARHRAWAAVMVCLFASLVAGILGRSAIYTQDGYIATLEERLAVAEEVRRIAYVHAETERCGSSWIAYAPRAGSNLCLIQDNPASIALRWGDCSVGGTTKGEP